MDIIVKQKIYIWVIIGLILLNLSVLIMMWLDSPKPPFFIQKENRPPVRDFFNKELELTAEQQKAFDESRDAHFKEVDSLMRLLEEKRRRVNQEVYRDKPDKTQIDVISDSIGTLTAQTEKLRVAHFAKLYSLLNNEQREKFKKMISETMRGRIIRFRSNDKNPEGPGGPGERRGDFQPSGREMPPLPSGEGIP